MKQLFNLRDLQDTTSPQIMEQILGNEDENTLIANKSKVLI